MASVKKEKSRRGKRRPGDQGGSRAVSQVREQQPLMAGSWLVAHSDVWVLCYTPAPTHMGSHCDCDGVRHNPDYCLLCLNTGTNKNTVQTTE